MKTFIFDLDHTVIDSSHRQLTRADGSLDLMHWKENCTREKIFRDRLLPLATFWRRVFMANHTVIVATARVMTRHDFEYLYANNLRFDSIVHRLPGDDTPDGTLKTVGLSRILNDVSNCVMFDDNASVRKAVRQIGIKAYHPNLINAA